MKNKPSCKDLTTEINTILFVLRDGKSKTDVYLSKKIGKNYPRAMLYVLYNELVSVDYGKTSLEGLLAEVDKCLKDKKYKMILKCSYVITEKGLLMNKIVNNKRKKGIKV